MTPRIVARDYVGGSAVLYTSPGGGIYRISVYFAGTDTPTTANFYVQCVDSFGTATSNALQAATVDQDNGVYHASYVFVMHAVAGGDISYNISNGNANAYIVIEEL